MTIYRETCGYETLTAERAPEFGIPPEDAGLWLIELDYDEIPMPTMRREPLTPEEEAEREERAVSVRVIPNTMARLAAGREIVILG